MQSQGLEKYVYLKDDSQIIYTKKGDILFRKQSENEIDNIDILDLNKNAAILLRVIHKNFGSKDIINDVARDVKVGDNYKETIARFINQMEKKGVITISDQIGPSNKSLDVIDSSKDYLISSATVEVTNRCNLMCKHCYMCASNANKDMVSFEEFKKIVDILLDEGVLMIELTGGEVFENPEFEKILRLSLDKFPMVGMLTNGTHEISKSLLDLLVENKEKIVVSVSIDSSSPQIHDGFRGMEGAFEKSTANIKKLADNGIFVRLTSAIFDDNMWQIHELAQLARDLGAKSFSYNFVEEFGRGDNFNKDHKVSKHDDYLSYINKTLEEFSDIIQIIDSTDFNRKSGNCGAGTSSFTIDSKKRLRPCVMSPTTFNIGTIDDSLNFKKEILDTLLEIDEPNFDNGCSKNCKFIYKCKGCYLRALNVNKKEGTVCSWIKKNNAENLLQYV